VNAVAFIFIEDGVASGMGASGRVIPADPGKSRRGCISTPAFAAHGQTLNPGDQAGAKYFIGIAAKGALDRLFFRIYENGRECRQFFEAAGNVIGSKNLSQTFQQKVAELETDLKKGYAQYEQTLQTLESDLRRIDEIKAAQEINLTLHQIHFRENEAIRNSITVGSDKGSTVNGGAVEVMEACTQKISAELKRYDEELQKLIRASEETKQRIRRLNLTEETRG